MKRISKRIAQVTVKRINDDSPDMSYLGEYSNRAESEYAIDRAHSLDCQSVEANHAETVEALERVLQYLDSQRQVEGDNPDSVYWEPLDDAIGLIADTQSEAHSVIAPAETGSATNTAISILAGRTTWARVRRISANIASKIMSGWKACIVATGVISASEHTPKL